MNNTGENGDRIREIIRELQVMQRMPINSSINICNGEEDTESSFSFLLNKLINFGFTVHKENGKLIVTNWSENHG